MIVTGLFLVEMVYGQEQDFDKVEIKTQPVTGGIYMLTGSGGNIGVSVGADGTFLIDDQYAPLTDKILKALSRITDQPPRFVINTHWHGDHTGGNENLGKAGAILIAHDNVRKRMSRENFLSLFNQKVPPSPTGALPVITFSETITFYLNGQETQVIHQAHAHTDGDGIVYFKESNVIHTGDLYFNGMYPFIDTSSKGSIQGVIAGTGKILELANDATKIIPGHGPLSSKMELQAYREMLIKSQERVQKLMDDGKTLEEIQALKPNSDFDPDLGNGFIQPDVFLKTIYDSLK